MNPARLPYQEGGLFYACHGLIGQIPIAGAVFTLVDTLMIFGDERRCIPELFADTKVVKT